MWILVNLSPFLNYFFCELYCSFFNPLCLNTFIFLQFLFYVPFSFKLLNLLITHFSLYPSLTLLFFITLSLFILITFVNLVTSSLISWLVPYCKLPLVYVSYFFYTYSHIIFFTRVNVHFYSLIVNKNYLVFKIYLKIYTENLVY